jgi:hypothetical protein
LQAANELETDGDDDSLEDPVIMAIACYQAGMYHPNSARSKPAMPDLEGDATLEGSEETSSSRADALVEEVANHRGALPDGTEVAMARQCMCGNEFLADTVFCRLCGSRRPMATAV